MFAREVNSDESMKNVLSDALLFKLDGEKGEGPEIAKKYGVRGWPTYIAVNGDGVVTDRWIGYEGPEMWVAKVTAAKADRRTIDEKKAAYEAEPTLALAKSLGNNATSSNDFTGAVNYYKAAREMDPAETGWYTEQILMSMMYGSRGGAFTFEEIDAEASAVLTNDQATPDQLIQLALMMNNMAGAMGIQEKAVPYIEAALKASEGTEDEKLMERRKHLEITYALEVENDKDKALKLRYETMPEGWKEDSNALNNFAWWCFENDVNLEEALELAIKGAELAESDGERANVLDTAAELCNALGNCDEAIAKMEQAIELDPERQYFKDQLAKFQKAAEEKKQG